MRPGVQSTTCRVSFTTVVRRGWLTAGDRGHSRPMPSLTERIQRFLHSPQGKRLVAEGRRQLAKPENQNRLRRLLDRLRGRHSAR